MGQKAINGGRAKKEKERKRKKRRLPERRKERNVIYKR
jgi:hypothetical protein